MQLSSALVIISLGWWILQRNPNRFLQFLPFILLSIMGRGQPTALAAGGAKTKADEAAVYGTTIETAYDLFLFLNAHYKEVTHQIVFQFVEHSAILFSKPAPDLNVYSGYGGTS